MGPHHSHTVPCPHVPDSFKNHHVKTLLLQLPVQPLWRKHRSSPQRNPRLLFVVFGTSGSSTAATLTEANKPCYLCWHSEQPVHVAREPWRKRPACAAVTLWLVINWKIKQEERDVSHGFEALWLGELWLQPSHQTPLTSKTTSGSLSKGHELG